jgi:septum formation protein
MKKIILASTSKVRAKLLSRLKIPFEICSPACDESVYDGEQAGQLVKRLSITKAQSLANKYPNSLIIGGDQVAVFGKEIIGKPNTQQNAIKQLQKFSGKSVIFHSGLCLLNSSNSQKNVVDITTHVRFRNNSKSDIKNYLKKEHTLNCAGSFKSEGLGICLFSSVKSDDFTAIMGLPLISLVSFLKKENITLL